MILNIYTIFDVKSGIYNRPFYMLNDSVAQRAALDLVGDPTTDISKHPEDFIFFRLGTYDDNHAIFNLDSDPVTLFRFHELQLIHNV